jgi:ribosomal protein S17E
MVIFVNSSFSFLKSSSVSFDQNLLIIEKLTTYSTKPKNYRNTPKGYATFGYVVQGNINNELATFEYKFPFIDNRNVTFKAEIHAKNMSSTVSGFGAHNSYFATVNDYGRLQSKDHSFLLQNMNKDGFFYRSTKSYDYGVNYNEIIAQSKDLTLEIARFIKNELAGNYTYENCIAAALNFVQYIPY